MTLLMDAQNNPSKGKLIILLSAVAGNLSLCSLPSVVFSLPKIMMLPTKKNNSKKRVKHCVVYFTLGGQFSE